MAKDLGTDISCVTSLDPACKEVTGRLCLLQALARRLSTPRGRLINDPNYGFDLTQYINDDVSPLDLARIKAGAEAECLKDDRVLGVDITLTLSLAGVLLVAIVVTDIEGAFTSVLSVTDVDVTILRTAA
jgi:phage baseplate assembly protein W